MDRKVAVVMKGFTALNSAERDEFVEELNKYRSGKTQDAILRKSLDEATRTTMNFGPIPGGCPCCGR
jgi:acyl-coenzyme A synthetase/AMP-(fatty) acid ligase